jgi:hypothetical protein
MALQNRNTLKSYFQSGDTPNESQFADLIDSLLAIQASDTGLSAISSLGNNSKLLTIDAGDHNLYYTTVADVIATLNGIHNTDNLPEGSNNLYLTNSRVRTALSSSAGISYNSSTGIFTLNATTDNITEGSTNRYYTDSRARNSITKSGNELTYNNATGVIGKNKAEQILTDASTIVFDVTAGYNARVTLAGNRSLSIINAAAGEYYKLTIIQDTAGAHTLTLPTGYKVINGANGLVTLTATANAIDIIMFYFDGTNFFVNTGLNYK